MGMLDPSTQINTLFQFLDNLPAGATLETQTNLEGVIHAVMSQVARAWDATGATKWYQDPTAAGFGTFSIKQIGDKPLAYPSRITPGTNDFTLGASAGGVLIDATLLVGGSGNLAVGGASPFDGGYVAAVEANFTVAGALGVGLSTAVDSDSRIVNLVQLIEAGTNDPVLDGGAKVFGLLQALTPTTDGAAIAGAGSENAQISFVKFDPGTDAVTAVSLPSGSYHFGLTIQRAFRSLAKGALLGGAVLPDIVDPGTSIPRQPCREFAVTGPGPGNQGPASQDPMDVTSGAFVTAGAATTTDATFGTTTVPATAASFVADDRYQVLRNGNQQSKGINFASGKECFFVSLSPPRIAFRENLRLGDEIYYRSI